MKLKHFRFGERLNYEDMNKIVDEIERLKSYGRTLLISSAIGAVTGIALSMWGV